MKPGDIVRPPALSRLKYVTTTLTFDVQHKVFTLKFGATDNHYGLLQFLGSDDSGARTHRELDDLGREQPLGLTLTPRERCFPEVLPGRGVPGPGLLPACSHELQ